MKKILSIVAVLALVLALSVSAFAAAPADPKVKSVIVPVDATGVTEALPGVSSGKAAAGQTEEVFELKVNDGEYTGAATVAFIYSKGGDVVAVYVQNDSGAWDEAKIDSVDGDIITVSFPHLSPVSFIVKTADQTVPGGQQGDKPSTQPGGPAKAAPGGAPRSPQTGYNTALWVIAAAAMTLCAGYFFTRKVTE